jgi:type III secretion protein HrpB1
VQSAEEGRDERSTQTRRRIDTSKLVWRTAVGAVQVAAGTSHQLGIVDVSPYSKIRVVADERVGSGTDIVIRLTITEGNELVAQLDTLHLAPHSQVTRVYEVPASKLTVYADALPGSGQDTVDVLVYGSP